MNLSVVLYICAILNIGVLSKKRKIIGGRNAEIRDFPYQAAIVFPNTQKFLCGGSIISSRHILTAAHCVYKGDYYYNIINIYTGISNTRSNRVNKFKIESVHIHPEYTGETSDLSMSTHDIAIIMIKGIIQFNEFQRMINLPTANYHPGNIVTITGWGLISYPIDNKSTILQKASVNILTISKCEEYFTFPIRSDQLCTLQEEGVGVCIGDSGGPVSLDDQLIGVISFNAPCARGIPDVHTNVYSYLSFIRSIIRYE